MISRHPRVRHAGTRSRLPACVAAIVAAGGSALASGQTPISAPTMAGARSIAQFTAKMALRRTTRTSAAPQQNADAVVVSSCADNGDFDTLRHAVLVANPGDTIDMSGLACSKITLGSALQIGFDDLTLVGPGAGKLTIDGGKVGRVFEHQGAGTLTLNDLTVANGVVEADQALGGCIYSKGDVALNRSVVTSCTAIGQSLSAGGGILAFGGLLAKASELSGNLASTQVGVSENISAAGGAVFTPYQVGLINSVVSGNVAESPTGIVFGGGAMGSALKVKYSTISDNEATSAGDAYNFGAGGGLVGAAETTILSSTIEHNTSDLAGALFLQESYPLTASIIQTTISSNTGRLGLGALSTVPAISIVASTIAFNTSGSLANVAVALNGAATMESSIIADNGPIDVIGGVIGGSHNLIKAVGPDTTVPMDTITLDPKLQPLAFNGGPTRTHALGSASPAINAGTNTGSYPSDQRGPTFKRVIGGAADIGAYERDTDHIFGSTLEYPLID